MATVRLPPRRVLPLRKAAMKGFKDFLMRGNLIELAVAFIIGGAFAEVVKAFTKIIMDIIGKFGGSPDFSKVAVADINIGVFLTALVSFVIMSAIVYFLVVQPYEKIQALLTKDKAPEVEAPTTDEILSEIRDLLKAQNSTR